MVDNAPNRDTLFAMSDFNATVGRNNASIERIIGKKGLGDVNKNGRELVHLCALNGAGLAQW